jgi:signal transduction histidine kinase
LFLFLAGNRRRRTKAIEASIVGVGGTVILALWLVVVASIIAAREAAMERTRSEGRNLAIAFAGEVNHIVDGVARAMEIIAQRMREAHGQFDIHAWAQEIPLLSSETILAVIVRPDGRIASTTWDPNPEPVDLSDREPVRVHLDGRVRGLFISKPLIGRTSHTITINVTRRVEAEDGTFLGIVSFSLPPANLTTLNRSIDLGARGSLALIGLDKVIRARFTREQPDGLAGIGNSVAGGPWPTSIAANSGGSFVRVGVSDQIPRLYSYRRVGDYPLVVVVGLDLDEALSSSHAHAVTIAAVAAGATLLLAGLAAYLIREIRRGATREDELAEERTKLEEANHRLLEDIALRQAVEHRLRESKDNLNRAQRIAKIGSFERDLRTGEVVCSEEQYRIFGWDPGLPPPAREEFLALVHPDDRARYAASMDASELGLSTPPLECRVCCHDGSTKWVYFEYEVTCDEEGRPLRRIGTVRDVTEIRAGEERQRELERQLIHSQKLEALGTLAGGIAHDLNNTLTPVLALSSLLAEEMPEGSRERADLELVLQASRHGRDLVHRILAFSRSQNVEKQTLNLAVTIRQLLQMLRATIPTTIAIRAQIEEVPPILGDPGQLQQVVVNLVTNGAQAIGDHPGTITVEVCPMDLAQGAINSLGTHWVRLRISDSGCGMDAETRERIFEPFFTTKAVGEGTGLGLSVVHGIVTGHGGRIEVTSEPGKGSEFAIFFPVVKSSALPMQAAAA